MKREEEYKKIEKEIQMKNGKKDDRMLDIWERLEERYYNLVRYLSPKTSIYFLCILFFIY